MADEARSLLTEATSHSDANLNSLRLRLEQLMQDLGDAYSAAEAVGQVVTEKARTTQRAGHGEDQSAHGSILRSGKGVNSHQSSLTFILPDRRTGNLRGQFMTETPVEDGTIPILAGRLLAKDPPLIFPMLPRCRGVAICRIPISD